MINQIKDFCECVKDATDKDVVELINIVSMATGWMRSPCETLILDQRREVIDLPPCEKCTYVFDPYYKEFDPDTFSFYLLTIQGTEEMKQEVTDFQYHESDGKFYINLPLPACGCSPTICGCPVEYKLKVEYMAGYLLLPECVLPAMCELLEVIRAKNDCCCDESCSCNTGEQEIKYACGDVTSVQMQTDFGKMVARLIEGSLGMLSIVRGDSNIWGVVV